MEITNPIIDKIAPILSCPATLNKIEEGLIRKNMLNVALFYFLDCIKKQLVALIRFIILVELPNLNVILLI
ncbi:hypothetical protein [Providencia hangzhouensis]|uniref:hypothetical protein n=1 Tax=Providencia hangzhouensis TaxID=3031799 RepID=UPI003979F497